MIALHNHSEYSALDGLSKCDEIASRVEAIGLGGAFLTDHGTVAGWRAFQKAMEAKGLFYGFGVEAYQTKFANRGQKPQKDDPDGKRDQWHLVLVAKNETGVKNIYRLCDEASRTGYYYVPRVDFGLLEKYHEGIIATSACLGGLVARGIRNDELSDLWRYRKIFGDDFFIELHTYDSDEQKKINEELVSISVLYGIPLVYANDAHYDKPENHAYHEIQIAIQYRESEDFEQHHPPCLYIMGEDDVRKRLSYLPTSIVDESISNSDLIADMCKGVTLPGYSSHLPVFRPRTAVKQNNVSLFVDTIEKGLIDRYGAITPEAEDRAMIEMETIINAGLVDYFLIEKDACDYLDEADIERGPGRGSAGGSIMSYAMKITDVDPLKYGLFFERFYNAGREKGLPDIDTDIEKFGRDKLIDYLKKRWGEHNVISIGNHIRMKPLASIEKAAKPLGVKASKDIEQIKRIIKGVPDIGIMTADQIGWKFSDGPNVVVAVLEDKIKHDDGSEEITPSRAAEELAPWIKKYPDLFDVAQYLTGRLFTYGVHASALVISDVDTRDYLPAMSAKGKDEDGETDDDVRRPVTMFEMHEVEELGFPKFDFLGLKTLDIIKEAKRLTGDDGYLHADPDDMPEDFWAQLDKGRGIGLFQVEEGMASKIAARLRPRNLLDLAAIVALNRPGPLRSGVVDRFIARRNGTESVVYLHDVLVPVLAQSFGDFLYQEQVIAYARAIGYDLQGADNIRSMLGKKKVADMRREFPNYLEKAKKFMSEEEAKEIWNNIIDFSKYSFNLSHAVEYGLILFRTMWFKWKYLPEYLMACIKVARRSKTKKQEKTAKYVLEGRRSGIGVNAPDINKSMVDIANIDGDIYFGLANVKFVGVDAAKWIIDHRPEGGYTSKEHLLQIVEAEQKRWEVTKKGKSPGQQLNTRHIDNLQKVGAFATMEEEIPEDRANHEQELLGVILSDDSAIVVAENEEEFEGLDSYIEALEPGGTYSVPGVITRIKQIVTKAGKDMAFVTIEWPAEDGGYDEFEFSVFEEQLKGYKFLLKNRTLGIFTVKTNDRGSTLTNAAKFERATVAS
jgi:DNA polymerase-3 subunit alpha